MSILLIVFFFMPWLKLSCNPEGIVPPAEMSNIPPVLAESTDLAHASGWELAGGKLTPEGPYANQEETLPSNDKLPRKRPWVYLCLALPIALLMLGFMGVSSNPSPKGPAKGMLLLGIVGLILMIIVATVDYTDDMLDQTKEELSNAHPGGPFSPGFASLDDSFSEMQSKMKEVIQTKGTIYLWGSLGLYVLIAGCGLAALGAPQTIPQTFSPPQGEGLLADDILAVGPQIYDPRAQSLRESAPLSPQTTPPEPVHASADAPTPESQI
jgi:hypothetical protein